MGKIKSHPPVKLILGMISNDTELFNILPKRFEKDFGEIDFESNIFLFNFTDYYIEEMGEGLLRKFVSFKRLLENPIEIANIKIFSNNLEDEFSINNKRRINLDPGYIEHGKLVLATTKNHQHRIYIGKGIFAEVTLRYRNKTFCKWDWTYPDYQTNEYIETFNQIRKIYINQLYIYKKTNMV